MQNFVTPAKRQANRIDEEGPGRRGGGGNRVKTILERGGMRGGRAKGKGRCKASELRKSAKGESRVV